MSEPRRPAHDRHDLELVARAAAGDLDPGDARTARNLLASCDACAVVAADLRAIASATRELGSAAARAASTAAPRDFRLTAGEAARLRRRGFLDRAGLSAWGARRARGFGGALVTLGLVGLLVSAGLPAFSGGASAPASEELGSGGARDDASPVPAIFPAPTDVQALASSGEPPTTDDRSGNGASSALTPSRVVTIVSIAVLLTGLALLLIGRAQHRTWP